MRIKITKQDWKDHGISAVFGSLTSFVIGGGAWIGVVIGSGIGTGTGISAWIGAVVIKGARVEKYSDKPRAGTYIASCLVAGGLVLTGAYNTFDKPDAPKSHPCKNAPIEHLDNGVAKIKPPKNCQFIIQ